MDAKLAREASELYGLPEADFTPARNARAKELRPADHELAAAVAKLPKPSRPLATINQLAREDPSELRALVQSGKRLRKLQEDAVRGKGQQADFAAATGEFREALERVQRQARARGLSDALLTRVASTLRTAALDPELQPLLERGLLAQEPDAAGFAIDPALVAGAPRGAAVKRPDEGRKRRAAVELKRARERVAEARRNARTAEKEVAQARRAFEAAETGAAKAASELEAAERELEALDHD